MTAVETKPGIFSISDTDPAWDMILRECEARGTLLLETETCAPLKLETTTTRPVKRPAMVSIPDFAAMKRKLGNTRIAPEAELSFFEALRGE